MKNQKKDLFLSKKKAVSFEKRAEGFDFFICHKFLTKKQKRS